MAGDDQSGGLPLAEKRGNDISHGLCLLNGKIHARAGIGQRFFIIGLCIFRGILVFIEAAAAPVRAAIAGSGRTIPSRAAEGSVLRAIDGAVTFKYAFSIAAAFKRHFAFVGKGPVELDFFTNGGFIFTDGPSDSGFG